jgi:predicted MFS family arabinose efflux permease
MNTDAPPAQASIRPIVLLSMASFCSMAVLRVAEPLLPEVAAEFETTAGAASIIATAFAFAYGIFQVFYGPLGDRFGKFRVITIATTAATVAVSATALADSLPALAWLRFGAGAVTAAVIPLSIAYIGDIVPYEARQQVLARFITGTILGLMFGQVAGGVIMEYFGWRSVFLILGGIYVLVTALLFIELRSPRVDRRRSAAPVRLGRTVSTYVAIMQQPHPRRVLIAVFLEGFLLYGGIAYLAAFLRQRFGIDYGTIGLLFAGFGGGGILYILISRPVIRRLGEAGMVLCGGVLVLAGFALMVALRDWPLAALANFLLGFGFFLVHNTLQTNATQMAPDARGSAVSLFAFCLFLGQAFGVATLGLVVDRAGYVPAFILCGGGMLILGWLFGRTLPRAS